MERLPDERALDKAPYRTLVSADDDEQAWLEARRKLLTASDIAAVLGWPRVGARHELWLRKRDELSRKRSPAYVREAGDMGKRLEPLNAELYQERSGRTVSRHQRLLQSHAYPWLGCTLDYHFLWSDSGQPREIPVELKSTVVEENWPPNDEPCAYWTIQLATQCLVVGSAWGSLSCIFGAPAFGYRWKDVPLEAELAEIVLHETDAFWRSIESNQCPAWNADLSTYDVLRRLDERRLKTSFVQLNEAAIDLDAEYVRLSERVRQARELVKQREAELEAVEAQLGALIAEAPGAHLPNGISYSFAVTHVEGYQVAPHHYRKLRRIKPKPLKGTRERSPIRKKKKP